MRVMRAGDRRYMRSVMAGNGGDCLHCVAKKCIAGKFSEERGQLKKHGQTKSDDFKFPKQKRQPVRGSVKFQLFLVARGGIEPPTQGFSM
jgi:hypothetical protein